MTQDIEELIGGQTAVSAEDAELFGIKTAEPAAEAKDSVKAAAGTYSTDAAGKASNTGAEGSSAAAADGSADAAAKTEPEPEPEPIPSMAEFEDELNRSFRRLKVGDMVTGTVIGISETEVTVDLNSYAEGIIKLEDLSNDPRFSIKADIHVGDTVNATVKYETKDGTFLLSMKEADDILSWDRLAAAKANRTVCRVKISEAVKAGASAYIYGIRAFIPASQLALTYVEDTAPYAGKELDVLVTEVDRESSKVILSARELLRERAAADRTSRISRLQTGIITRGRVEKLASFGAFVNIGEDLSGLVHISQICGHRIKSPAEVLKVGDEVTVKIMDIKDGKISLSMTAAQEPDDTDVLDDAVEDAPEEYSDGGSVSTGLAALLKNLHL